MASVRRVPPSGSASRRIRDSILRHTQATASILGSEGRTVRGWHRRHGRKPCCSAASGKEKKTTCSRRGLREGHDGRQYMPVERTPYTNTPSAPGSRACMDFQRASTRGGFRLFIVVLGHAAMCGITRLRFMTGSRVSNGQSKGLSVSCAQTGTEGNARGAQRWPEVLLARSVTSYGNFA